MSSLKLLKEEKIIFQGEVKIDSKKVKLTLTNKRMIFQKFKGIFIKKLKVIDSILLDDINVYDNVVQVKRKKFNVIVKTSDKNITLTCIDSNQAKKIVKEIVNLKGGLSLYERSKIKLEKAMNFVKDAKEIINSAYEIAETVDKFKNHDD